MKHFLHIFILLGGIAGVVLLNKYWKAETAFMKELADYHLIQEEKIKSRKYSNLEYFSRILDSNYRITLQKDRYYLKKIDTITSKEKFYQLIGDSLSEKYAFKDFKDFWHEPPEVRELYRNDLTLASIDSMLDKTILGREHHYELVIKEIQIRADSLKFEVDFFEVIGRDTPFIHPITGEVLDTTDIEFYEAKILEY